MAVRERLDRILGRIEDLSMWVAVAALALVGVLVLLAVPARQLPWLQIPDSYLMVKMLMLMAVALGLGHVTGHGGHISVDILYVKFSRRGKKVARYIALAAGLVFFVPLAWWYADLTIDMAVRGRTQTGLLRLPRWPLYLFMFAGFLLVSLRLVLLVALGAPDRDSDAEKEY